MKQKKHEILNEDKIKDALRDLLDEPELLIATVEDDDVKRYSRNSGLN